MILLIFLISLFVFIVSFLIYFLDSDIVTKIFKRSSKYNIQDEMKLFDEAKWVEKVIDSCKTRKQLYPTFELIHLLKRKYQDKVDYTVISMIFNTLLDLWSDKTNKLGR